MISSVFSIPLEAENSRANRLDRDGTSREGMLREYIGSQENRLVEFAVSSLFERKPRYNPLLLYGPTGTGKSFLALGLSERWQQLYSHETVCVTCGPDFASSFANAVDTNDLPAFRRSIRSASLFVLDDVHLLSRKRAVQEELVRTIDALLERGGTALLTDSKTPSTDSALLPALRSRLLGGLAVPLMVPGPAARQLLVRRLLTLHHVHFSDTAITLLAGDSVEQGDGQLTVPELNHAVLQLGHAERSPEHLVDVDQVQAFLRERELEQQPTVHDIAACVAKHFSLTVRELRGPSRRRHVTRARGVAMLLAWKLTDKSLGGVGQYFGKRDHTTVLHACRRTESLEKTDAAISKAFEELRNQLKMRSSSGASRRRN